MICAVPILLFIPFVWRLEKGGWVKARSLEHPLSYILLILIFLPCFIYTSSILVSRLTKTAERPVTAVAPVLTQQPTPSKETQTQQKSKEAKKKQTQPIINNGKQQTVLESGATVSQKNSGGCNQVVIGGNNNSNYCAAPSRQLADDTKEKIAASLRASGGEAGQVVIVKQVQTDDSVALATDICEALNNGGWGCDPNPPEFEVANPAPPLYGLTCFVPDATYGGSWESPVPAKLRAALKDTLPCAYRVGWYMPGGGVVAMFGGRMVIVIGPVRRQ